MKSEHRHELETNWLAHHTAIWLDKIQPYYSLIAGGVLTVAIVMLAYSYFGGESAARQDAAWNQYNLAVEGYIPNLDRLHESADEFPDSPMQQFADITWADGQLAIASQYFVQNRVAANEALNRASGEYQSLLQASEDERIKDRAHFGLGRVYELQNELDKALAEYRLVKGGFSVLAEERIKQLEKQDTKDAYAWLATAEGPRRTAPLGPGTPGQRPGFSPGEIALPSATSGGEDTGAKISIDDLFQGLDNNSDKDDANVTDRYETGDGKPAETSAEDGDSSQPKADAKSADGEQPKQ